jgi:hypothetical protein
LRRCPGATSLPRRPRGGRRHRIQGRAAFRSFFGWRNPSSGESDRREGADARDSPRRSFRRSVGYLRRCKLAGEDAGSRRPDNRLSCLCLRGRDRRSQIATMSENGNNALASTPALTRTFHLVSIAPSPAFGWKIDRSGSSASKPDGYTKKTPAVAGGVFCSPYESRGRTIRGRTMPGAAAVAAHTARAAPGKVRPLARPQVVGITPSGFWVSAGRWTDAEQSTSPKIGFRRPLENAESARCVRRFRHGIDVRCWEAAARRARRMRPLTGGIEGGGCDCLGA